MTIAEESMIARDHATSVASLAMSILLALFAASAAFLVVFLLAGRVAFSLGLPASKHYLAYSVVGFAAALTFVATGAMVVRSGWRLHVAVFLFLAGAAVAWRLLAGRGYDNSPPHGQFELALTLVGGGIGIAIAIATTPRVHGKAPLLIAAVIPLVLFLASAVHASLTPEFGHTVILHYGHRESIWVATVQLQREAPRGQSVASQRYIVMSRSDSALIGTRMAGGPLYVESDIGSGGVPAKLSFVEDASIRRRLERQAAIDMRKNIESEIAGGYLPSPARHWPYSRPDFSRQSVVVVRSE